MPAERLFLGDFSYISGEAEMVFHRTILARDMRDAERKIRSWLRNHGPDPEQVGRLSYIYADGMYALKYHGLIQTTPESLVRYLSL